MVKSIDFDEKEIGQNYSVSEDIITLTLASPVENFLPVELVHPIIGESVWVPGYFYVNDVNETFKKNTASDLKYTSILTRSIRYTKDASKCVVLGFNKGCIVHSCQAIGGYSGAPVVSLDRSKAGKSLALIGIHSRNQSGEERCTKELSKPVFNIAASVLNLPITK